MKSANGTRRGFTLVETVVTVGLLAVLASFVIPTILQKSDSADPVKVANDLNAIASAIQTFGSDLKSTYPGDLQDLTTPLRVSTTCGADLPCDSTVTHRESYSVAQATQQWKGPYLTISITDEPDAIYRSGYVADFHNTLVRYDAVEGVPEYCQNAAVVVTCPTFDTTHVLAVAVKITGLNQRQLRQVNDLVDGAKETIPENQGRFRYRLTSDTAYYLATPLALTTSHP